MMNVEWKKTIIVLVVAEIFWCSIGLYVHEGIHDMVFFIQTGKLGTIHVLDTVALKMGFPAVCTPPQGIIFYDSVQNELFAYGIQMAFTFLFAFFLFKLHYSSERRKTAKKA